MIKIDLVRERLDYYREKRNLSYARLASMIGVSRQTVWRFLQPRSMQKGSPKKLSDIELVVEACKVLNVSTAEILYGQKDLAFVDAYHQAIHELTAGMAEHQRRALAAFLGN